MPNGEALLRGRRPRKRPRNACQLDNRIGVPSSEGLDGEGEKGYIDVSARLKEFGHLSRRREQLHGWRRNGPQGQFEEATPP